MSKSPEQFHFSESEDLKNSYKLEVDMKPLGIERMPGDVAVKALLEIINNAAFSPLYTDKVEKVANAIVELGIAIKNKI